MFSIDMAIYSMQSNKEKYEWHVCLSKKLN